MSYIIVASRCRRGLGRVSSLATIVLAMVVASAAVARAQPAPPPLEREFRAAWITPTEGGDWPSRPGLSVDEQKAELTAVLDAAKADGLNAVLLHVRTAADAFYPTQRAPWSRYLTGRDGSSLGYAGYDPVALAIDEAHARGLQLHVWFNPFRAMPPDDLGKPAPGHITHTHPEWVRHYGKSTWIDPGIPAARRAVLDAILEVVDRYDIDGVHIDDYFYPYLEERTITRVVGKKKHRRRITRHVTLAFPDDASWRKYGVAKGWTDRAAWRRANVDDFVRTLYAEVKARKRWVLVGISPFGIWRPGYPQGITGLDSYSEVYADTRKWLREGWLDYLAPQLYWPLDNYQQRFTRLDAWWRSENALGRHLWPGLFTMRVASRNDPWPADEIAHEVDALRDARRGTSESLGHVHFRMRTLLAPVGGDTTTFGAALRTAEYATPAVPPASPWLGDAAPAMPRLLVPGDAVQQGASGDGVPSLTSNALVTVAVGDTVPVRWWVVQTLGIDGQWRERTEPAMTGAFSVMPSDVVGAEWIAVTALSRTGVASPPALWKVEH
ncbi:MAG TPA: family 10 glycosylhydrolase [Gemmatimonadaceae bacterium]|nr:family 10 glycosylhydrolase [Gemmatimonadaceae bacterium]